MPIAGQKLAFVLTASKHGTMIVNRFDYRMAGPDYGDGVGFQILETAAFDPGEVKVALELLALRRKHHGDGVIAIDCGANIGVHTVEWASEMTGWGSVIAIEAQERIYYALAGNIAINNCFNALAVHAAVSSASGTMQIPNPNYFMPSSFGSLELRQGPNNEFIGQPIDYANNTVTVQTMTLDELNLARVDFIKIDIEGMEMEALEGARETIRKHRPILLIEKIKTDNRQLEQWLRDNGYQSMAMAINVLAVHQSDRCLKDINPQQSAGQAA
ncbi:FkbM family methyltransferase [Bradyrhizobium sp. 1]|uniref:FkbM family methyltransferase n=1 Tax=Bradyrhizobium sp. 1 TaxID=241591 RepID=UPI001FF7C8FE|nr:FkbM family methyltransferase [Bradyrhizobium sp. 1]MCK1395845.1 FkbM family methyltransferase [Bradyrhizobium sp. 1]